MSPSRLTLSSKYPLGVLEDRLVPETTEVDTDLSRNVSETYIESFNQFCQKLPHQDYTCPPSLTFESWMTG